MLCPAKFIPTQMNTFIVICYFDLEDGVEPGEHVLELLLLLVGEGGDHGLHLARLEVGHLEHVLHQQLRVDQPRPREQVDEPGNGKHNIVICRFYLAEPKQVRAEQSCRSMYNFHEMKYQDFESFRG